MSEIELKPCPFCGEEVKGVEQHTNKDNTITVYGIGCKNFFCAIRPRTVYQRDEESVIRYWNTRNINTT